MPATPGTSTTVTVDPAIGLTESDTLDPFFGIEAGRTYVPTPAPTVFGGEGTDTVNVTPE
jgi:hypothetical protein